MSWSAALGLAGSAFGAISASKTASAQLAQQQYQFGKQMEMQELQLGMARDAQRQQGEEREYQRQIEQMNRLIAQQERNYQKQQSEENKAQLMEERRAVIERQILEDKEAAKQRQFQLEQLLQNQDLRADEREFAIAQLNEAKAVASGERDEDMRRFMEEREMAKLERDFVVSEYQDYKTQMDLERQEEMSIRNQILNNIYGLQDSLIDTQRELGVAPEIAQITEADIAREIERRTQENLSDVDRAADRVASINEADLIRKGLDESTPGSRRRADIASQLSQEYANARSRAYDDAMSYISGKSSAMANNVGDILNRRQQLLSETGLVQGAGIEALQNLRALPSSAEAYAMATRLPSAIYNRSVSSANDFSAPVTIGSAVYDDINVGPALAQYRSAPSAATNIGMNVGSAIFNPYGVTVDTPQTYMSNAGQIGNQLLSSATSASNNAATASYNASAGFGKSMFDFLGSSSTKDGPTFGEKFDSYINGLFD